jgi:glycine cleavage system H lipoate-binding protein
LKIGASCCCNFRNQPLTLSAKKFNPTNSLAPKLFILSHIHAQPTALSSSREPAFSYGRTWTRSESPSLVPVGRDDFGSKLAGKVEQVKLPQRGQWARQGQKILTIQRGGAAVDMVSPIAGSVADINEALARDPEPTRKDPYAKVGC